MRNNLDRETSPYLLQHKDNPVHWQAWSPETLALAKEQQKPILLSVGYAACHWCHVMAHESFENDAIAGVMNELFINIKVDREERPDIDTIYQTALQLLGEHGGWPLTMFLTPDGKPFWGGTYFPPESRWGRPGFPDVLRRVREVYDSDPAAVQKNEAALLDALRKINARPEAPQRPELSNRLLDEVSKHLLGELDTVNGGVGGAPKFPQPYLLEQLWRTYRRRGDTATRDAVLLTLTKMSQGGLYDHLGGGYARYSTDARWLVPHFEKMLYDNAQLVDLLALVWQETRDPLFEQRLRETIEWTLREMVADGGAFAATLDADSEGEEGKYYVWQESEIDAVLGAESAVFKEIYDVTPTGNWEGKTILNRIAHPAPLEPAQEAALARMRGLLFEARQKRIRPGWDDKVLADWNGLMIAAIANAASAITEPAWLDAAKRAFRFVAETMIEDGRLRHVARRGEVKHDAILDDYANMCRAALALYEATGEASYLARAVDWAAVVERHYSDDLGGYFLTADDAEALIVRTKNANDNAVPSGNGTMLGVLARLWHLTGEEVYRHRADRLIAAFAGELGRNFFPMMTFLNSFDLLANGVQVVVVGKHEATETETLRRAAYSVSAPNRIYTRIDPDAALPTAHPAHGKQQKDGAATAYVCTAGTCSLPITTPEGLVESLRAPAS